MLKPSNQSLNICYNINIIHQLYIYILSLYSVLTIKSKIKISIFSNLSYQWLLHFELILNRIEEKKNFFFSKLNKTLIKKIIIKKKKDKKNFFYKIGLFYIKKKTILALTQKKKRKINWW